MSTNAVNKSTGELVTLANGTRMWIGTQSAHDLAVQEGTMPNNCMVCITDDYPNNDGFIDNSEFTYNPAVVGTAYTPPSQEYLRVARQGNIVIVAFSHMTFNLATSISVDTELFRGLPAPAGNSFGVLLFLDNNALTVAYVKVDGSLMLSPGHPGSIQAGNKQLYGSIIYYTEA